jgi:hypothetical protein
MSEGQTWSSEDIRLYSFTIFCGIRVQSLPELGLSYLNAHGVCGFSLHCRSFLMASRPTITSPSAELCWLTLDIFDASSASGPGRFSQAMTRVKLPATARLDITCDPVGILQLSHHYVSDN